MKGQIKTLKKDKNYGFIYGEDKNEYFFHSSSCREIFEGLDVGDKVTFDDFETEKGYRAESVQLD